MGRGRSNRTKLYWAFGGYKDQWLTEHPVTRGPIGTVNAIERQLKASRWFKKHFIETIPGQHTLENALHYLTQQKTMRGPISSWFHIASNWPLDKLTLPIKTPGVAKTKKGQVKAKPPWSSKYLYLKIQPQHKGTETEWRQRAQFFLILVQHFLGRTEAKKLLIHFKKHRVKYRKIRIDKGLSLSGADKVEFQMRLGGHQLLIGGLSSETPAADG
jgi:hypothetical protein